MMSMIGLISSDIYLPSMPYIAHYFHEDYRIIQRTITVYLIGLAIFQLIYGPVSDHFGRKRTLQFGVCLYILASLSCTLSSNITMLMISRFFQAIGASASLVMGRCMVSDIYDRQETTRIFSIVLPMVSLSPAIAPVIGGYLQTLLGWRAVLAFTVIFGTFLLLIITTQLGETLPRNTRKNFHIKIIIKNNLHLFGSSQFLIYTLVVGATYCSWFAYLANSSYVYRTFQLPANIVGYCYISQSLAAIIGSRTAKHSINLFELNPLLFIAISINLLASLLMLFFWSS